VPAPVRACIGRANEDRGISAKLARLDALNKLMGHYRAMTASAESGSLELAELADYAVLGKENPYSSLMANVVDPASRAEMAGTLADLNAEATLLSDEIAEANAARLSFELEDDLAAFATGVA
jgi:hypothetical protein